MISTSRSRSSTWASSASNLAADARTVPSLPTPTHRPAHASRLRVRIMPTTVPADTRVALHPSGIGEPLPRAPRASQLRRSLLLGRPVGDELPVSLVLFAPPPAGFEPAAVGLEVGHSPSVAVPPRAARYHNQAKRGVDVPRVLGLSHQDGTRDGTLDDSGRALRPGPAPPRARRIRTLFRSLRLMVDCRCGDAT